MNITFHENDTKGQNKSQPSLSSTLTHIIIEENMHKDVNIY